MANASGITSGLVFIIVLCFIVPSSIPAAADVGDLGSLIALRNSLNQSKDAIPDWFDAKIHPCNWTGITCEGFLVRGIELICTVTSLDLPFPVILGKFHYLTYLNLRNCGLTGKISESFWRLEKLEMLDLSYNRLSGVIPPAISNLKSLVSLLAVNAGLSGKIPAELGNCTRLKIVDMSLNQLDGPLPKSLAGLESIISLTLSSNHLSGPVPNWISNWKQVQYLNLARNFFNGSVPSLNLPFLTLLDVRSNMLSELPAEMCNDAESMVMLVLSDNNFTGTVGDTFRKCSSLGTLELFGNKLFGELPAYLGELPLVVLKLSGNRFNGSLPYQLWESKTLLEISLSKNLLQGQISLNLTHDTLPLKRLELDDNLLVGNIPSSIGHMKNLTNLSLRGNKLTGEIPEQLFQCTKLVSLDLGANKFTGTVPKSISKLKLLDNLVLSDNKFSGPIPLGFCSRFQRLHFSDSEFIQHRGLLDLSHNEFVGPIPAAIKKCNFLTELLLQGNKLSGEIPVEISGLSNLTLIDLSSNAFTGPAFPQNFSSMRNLQGLILSNNQLSGPIPHNIGSLLPSLAKLNLSYNGLTGPLPSSVFKIIHLNQLDINMNLLSGSISPPGSAEATSPLVFFNASSNYFSGNLDFSLSHLTSLSVLDIHNNSFSGSVPSWLSDLSALTYVDFSDNRFEGSFPCTICGIVGLNFLNFSGNELSEDVPVTCSKTGPRCASNHSSPPDSNHPSPPDLNRASTVAIVVSVAVVSVVGLVGGVIWWWMKDRRESEVVERGNNQFLTETTQNSTEEAPKEPPSINLATFQTTLHKMNLENIRIATNNFSQAYLIGEGGFGRVYRASLAHSSRSIAIKRLHGGYKAAADDEFSAEMETLGKIEHPNLVPLLGYCSSKAEDEALLIYEYMENGGLDERLRNRPDGIEPLDWPTRLKICLGAARGLSFLHYGVVPVIIHRDIKSSNILLDSHFNARISDFGYARTMNVLDSQVRTKRAGSVGYVPPEYFQIMMGTTQGDVYSFGLVMLEIITGEAPSGHAEDQGDNLVGWVRLMVGLGKEHEVLDPSIATSEELKKQMLEVLAIARLCTDDDPSKRPKMFEVVKLLQAKMEDAGPLGNTGPTKKKERHLKMTRMMVQQALDSRSCSEAGEA